MKWNHEIMFLTRGFEKKKNEGEKERKTEEKRRPVTQSKWGLFVLVSQDVARKLVVASWLKVY